MASRHKITAVEDGVEYQVTFEYRAGSPAVMYLRNGDPGYPADPDELEVVSVTPDGLEIGAAQEWLETDGLDEAMSIVLADQNAAREYAADLRADR